MRTRSRLHSASTGVTTDLVENYLKIIDINNAYKSTIEYNYEVVQVTKVSADTLTGSTLPHSAAPAVYTGSRRAQPLHPVSLCMLRQLS